MNYWLIFLTGLTTGGVSCAALQAGLLASVITNQKDQQLSKEKASPVLRPQGLNQLWVRSDWQPIGLFLVSKLIVHTLFGFLLGLAGSAISLSLEVRLIFQAFTAVFMFGTAMNLLDVHHLFRFFAFQPPKFLRRLVRSSSKSSSWFAPALLGVLTLFVPCGVTQAMELLAINTGDPVAGSLIMFTFVLGTVPFFSLIGMLTARFSEYWQGKFLRVAAIGLVLMALYSANGILVVLDAPVTFSKLVRPVTYFFSAERFAAATGIQTAVVEGEVQKILINVIQEGYEPRHFRVKQGMPVELTIKTNGVYSCATSFTMQAFGIHANLGPTDQQSFTFTPNERGQYSFSCSMGMYAGVMEVI